MDFQAKRRQQFMGASHYVAQIAMWDEVIEGQRTNLNLPEGKEKGWHCSLLQGIADGMFIKLCLRYTAGEPMEPMRVDVEHVVAAFEAYGAFVWDYYNDRNESVFTFTALDDYSQLMQLIGLCFLLHRRDLLPRIAALQDGLDAAGQLGEGNGGTDTLYEEFMAHALGADVRYETDWLCCSKPYAALFHALTEKTPAASLKELNLFLKRWYKDLAGTGWHDSHKPDEAGNQGGYYGYWSFEAGAAVLLLGIEDDSSLHQYLYYPKHLVAWSREHAALSDANEKTAIRLRAMAGEPCPREGHWFTPARTNSRQRFTAGEVMPDAGGDYGTTVWQWDEQQ
jgi:Domain of unknown function (DUF1911)